MKVTEAIKKEINEMAHSNEHMNESFQLTNDFESNIKEPITLSERTNSGFTVRHQDKIVEIIASPQNIIFVVLSIITIFIPFIICINDSLIIEYKVLFVALYIVMFYFLMKVSTETRNHILIDLGQKVIKINNNNVIGKYLHSKREIEFKLVEDIFYKSKSISGKVSTSNYTQIYLTTNKDRFPIIDLPCGPYYFVNQDKFLAIIKTFIQY